MGYLEALGDAGTGIPITPLADDRKTAYTGEYALADASDERVQITLSGAGQLSIGLKDELGYSSSRRIHHLGNDEFFPAGVPSVRVRFVMSGEKALTLTIVDRTPVLVANRV